MYVYVFGEIGPFGSFTHSVGVLHEFNLGPSVIQSSNQYQYTDLDVISTDLLGFNNLPDQLYYCSFVHHTNILS